LEDGDFLGHQPLANPEVKSGGLQAVEHPEEGAVAGRAVAAGLGVLTTTQRPQLPLGQLFALIFKGLVATGAHEHGHGRAGQHERLRMPQTMPAATILELAKDGQQRVELSRAQRARPADLLLMLGPVPR
jgi:hypothetical protein